MSGFTPQIERLPSAQRQLWPRLREAPSSFVLYGGTGLALRLAHRDSVDFDFFSSTPFVPDALQQVLPFAHDAEALQKERNTLTLLVPTAGGPVKVSFFGGLTFGRVGAPDACPNHGLRVASLRDLFAAKLNVIHQRAEAKDYLDIHAILEKGTCSLAEGLGCARAIFGETFNVMLPLKALAFFEGGDLGTLPAPVKDALLRAVRSVSDIPSVPRASDHLVD